MRFRVFFPFKPAAQRRDFLHHHPVPGIVFLMQLSYALGH
jgi:hypothetical protein